MDILRAIVAAGGHGRRLNLDRPKSSLEFKGKSLIWWTVSSLREAGFEVIQVCVDDATWADEFAKQLEKFSGVRIIHDLSYPSTFLLFRDYSKKDATSLFTYGHAPRPAKSYEQLLTIRSPVVASVVTQTSMRQRVVAAGGVHLEPPYLIRLADVCVGEASNWQQFFEKHASVLRLAPRLDVGEFNLKAEWIAYQAYMRKAFGTNRFEQLNNREQPMVSLTENPCS